MLEQFNKHLAGNRASQKVLLVDGDIIKYRIGFAAETMIYNLYVPYSFKESHTNFSLPFTFEGKKAMNEFIAVNSLDQDLIYYDEQCVPDPVEHALHSVNRCIEAMQNQTECGQVVVYITGKGNYRDDIATQKVYKGNRKDSRKPYHFQAIHDHMVKMFKTYVIDGMEADDAMGIHQHTQFMKLKYKYENQSESYSEYLFLKKNSKTIIATLDKDLDCIPGWHYNWVGKNPSTGLQGVLYWTDEDQSMRHFFSQVMSGDSTDNIPGVTGIGKKKSEAKLAKAKTTQEMYDITLNEYVEWLKSRDWPPETLMQEAQDRMDEAAKLVWILRSKAEKGKAPWDMTDGNGEGIYMNVKRPPIEELSDSSVV